MANLGIFLFGAVAVFAAASLPTGAGAIEAAANSKGKTLFTHPRDRLSSPAYLRDYTYAQYLADFGGTEASSQQGRFVDREAMFYSNLRRVIAHNSDPHRTFSMTVNPHMDLSAQEFRERYSGSNRNAKRRGSSRRRGGKSSGTEGLFDAIDYTTFFGDDEGAAGGISSDSPVGGSALAQKASVAKVSAAEADELPKYVNWAERIRPLNIRQQKCGDCASHAPVVVAEYYAHADYRRQTGALLPTNHTLSVQQVSACHKNPRNCGKNGKPGGCNGGVSELGFDYIAKSGGLVMEREYPYNGTEKASAECRFEDDDAFRPPPVVTIGGYEMLPTNDLGAVMRHLAHVGPLAVSVDASLLGFYGHGIFNQCQTGKKAARRQYNTVNHDLSLIGYGEVSIFNKAQQRNLTHHYWILANSWGNFNSEFACEDPHEYEEPRDPNEEDYATFDRVPNVRAVRDHRCYEQGYYRLYRAPPGSEEGEGCGLDHDVQQGHGCDGDVGPIEVCGECGILSFVSYPTNVRFNITAYELSKK